MATKHTRKAPQAREGRRHVAAGGRPRAELSDEQREELWWILAEGVEIRIAGDHLEYFRDLAPRLGAVGAQCRRVADALDIGTDAEELLKRADAMQRRARSIEPPFLRVRTREEGGALALPLRDLSSDQIRRLGIDLARAAEAMRTTTDRDLNLLRSLRRGDRGALPNLEMHVLAREIDRRGYNVTAVARYIAEVRADLPAEVIERTLRKALETTRASDGR